MEKSASETNWNGPYLRKAIPANPWGNSYVHRQLGAKHDFDLVSYGRDGKPGGSGEDADLTN